ncbi:MAG: hypothetical protein J6T92_02435, partial [Ottowia sp.]|nr:hypothetical protein [Ottowia sp.]
AAPKPQAAAPAAAGSYADMLNKMPEKTRKAYEALQNAVREGKATDAERMQALVGLALAAGEHSDPEIRRLPYIGMTWNLEKGEEAVSKFAAQLKKEQDPKVLDVMLSSHMNNLFDADIYAVFKQHATHENVDVRMAAMKGLINSNNRAVEGIEAEAIKFMDDADESVRVRACENLLRAGNSLVLPQVEAMLKGTDASQEKVLAGCAKGLLNQWYYAPFFKEFDAKAYQLTLDYLNKTPRSKELPTWTVLSTLGKAPKDEWKTLAKEYKGKDVTAALVAVAKDAGASKQAREYAIGAIAVHGTKADLEALAKALGDDPVAKVVEKTLQKLNS